MATKYNFGFKPDEEKKRRDEDRARRERAKERAKAERERARQYRERSWRHQWEQGRQQYTSSAAQGYIPQADRAMALEIINAGYRAMSRKHHPDFGGNHDQMVAVNRALEALRKLVK